MEDKDRAADLASQPAASQQPALEVKKASQGYRTILGLPWFAWLPCLAQHGNTPETVREHLIKWCPLAGRRRRPDRLAGLKVTSGRPWACIGGQCLRRGCPGANQQPRQWSLVHLVRHATTNRDLNNSSDASLRKHLRLETLLTVLFFFFFSQGESTFGHTFLVIDLFSSFPLARARCRLDIASSIHSV